MSEGLTKQERLFGKTAVGALFVQGQTGQHGCIRYRVIQSGEDRLPRRGVSGPKRNFKRAVKRNLLKRRIRESYRRLKTILPPGLDILFIYTSREVLPYEAVYADMEATLGSIAGKDEGND